MTTDFPTAPLAPGHKEAGGGTVEKSLSASHTEILTPPPLPKNPGVCPCADLGVFHFLPNKRVHLPPPAALLLLISKVAKLAAELIPGVICVIELYRSK